MLFALWPTTQMYSEIIDRQTCKLNFAEESIYSIYHMDFQVACKIWVKLSMVSLCIEQAHPSLNTHNISTTNRYSSIFWTIKVIYYTVNDNNLSQHIDPSEKFFLFFPPEKLMTKSMGILPIMLDWCDLTLSTDARQHKSMDPILLHRIPPPHKQTHKQS